MWTRMLAIVLASRPEFAAAAFDVGGPNFRSEQYADYKQGRRPMPDDLRPQIERTRQILEVFDIPIFAVSGVEADDVVGTLAHSAEERGLQVTIVSGDLDCLQCVTDSIEALVPRRGITDTMVYGPDQVRQRYNLEPRQLIDYKALRGDTSDNIPGVPGVGEKTAGQLIADYGSIEDLYEHLDELKPGRVKDALARAEEQVRLGKALVTIRKDVPGVELDLEACRWLRYDAAAARRLFDELEFRQLLARFPPPDAVTTAPIQATLAFEPAQPAGVTLALTGSDGLRELHERLRGTDEVGVFGLWDGAARDGKLVGVGLGFEDAAYYLPVRHPEGEPRLPPAVLAEEILQPAKGLELLGHDVKEIELPLARVLALMEQVGVAVDVPYLETMNRELAEQLGAIEAEIADTAGYSLNINAPQQLAKLLFEDLKLPVGKRIKTGYSTDAETLEGLRAKHPVIPLILDHRQLSKLKSTYVDALPGLVDPRDGRVHTSLNQAATATGRLSSSNPNLMNIPIRTELGQRIRRAFVAGREACNLFAADYSQIELRIAAHLSEDPNLLSAFEAGQGIHAPTAARVFKVPIEDVTPDQRRMAKVANFGSIYGQGEYGLSQQMGIPGDEAREFLKEYWGTYAHLKEWLDGVRGRAREEGFVVSPTGRRRGVPDLRPPNRQLRQAAERMAVNFPIQSLAADIIKIAMVRLEREMEEARLDGQMILQVHDELVFEVPEREVTAFAEMVPRVMVGAYELQAGLEVEAKAGPNWADMRKLAEVRA